MTPDLNLPDHDLLQRLYVRQTEMAEYLKELRGEVRELRSAVDRLKVESARNGALYGSLAGIITALIVALAVAGMRTISPG